MDTWKQFDQNVISHSAAHHLMAIDTLIRRLGYARVSDVARQLEITRGSVSISLKPLKAEGLVEQDENRFLRLSPRGQHLVDVLRARRFVIVQFLSRVLGVEPQQAEIDSCKIEHLLSTETAERLTDFLRYIAGDDERARRFRQGLADFDRTCEHRVGECPCCEHECLGELTSRDLSDNKAAVHGPEHDPVHR